MKWKRLAGKRQRFREGNSPFRSRKSARTPFNYTARARKVAFQCLTVLRVLNIYRLHKCILFTATAVFISHSDGAGHAMSPLYSADRLAYGSLHDIHLEERAYNYNHGRLSN
jgi:hypothetical protein